MSKQFIEVSAKEMAQELSKNAEWEKEYEATRPMFEAQRAILKMRKTAGISQKVLAQRIGISPGDLSKIERGKDNTTVKTLYKVADALDKKLEISFK